MHKKKSPVQVHQRKIESPESFWKNLALDFCEKKKEFEEIREQILSTYSNEEVDSLEPV